MKAAQVYLGKPCAHGHSGLRYVSKRTCVECARGAVRKRNAELAQARAAVKQPPDRAELRRLSILAIYYQSIFDRQGWRQAEVPSYD